MFKYDRKLKKISSVIILIIITLVICSIQAIAAENSLFQESIWNEMDNESIDRLNDLGINKEFFDNYLHNSPIDTINGILKSVLPSGRTVVKSIITILFIIIISSLADSFIKENDKRSNIIYFICSISIATVIIKPISQLICDAALSIKLSTVFTSAYLPVMTSIIIASKNPSLAFTYNTFTLFISTLISNFANKFFTPIILCLMCFNIICSLSFEKYKQKVFDTIKKIIISILALFSTIYSGLLASKSILAYSSDSLALKGIKFLSGTFIPIIGSGVGEAITSVINSFSILKNTAGIFIIIIIILINVPVMIELLIWYFSLLICSSVSSLFGLSFIDDVLQNISSLISLVNTILFFITFILIISTGIIITIGK